MKTPTLLAALGLALWTASPAISQGDPADGVKSSVQAVERRGSDRGSTDVSTGRYEVPLLQVPAFIDAAAATGAGASNLLQSVSEKEFGQSLGAQYWTRGESGWSAAARPETAIDWQTRSRGSGALGNGISFATLPMRDGPALPEIVPAATIPGQQLTGRAGLFTEAGQSPAAVDPTAHLGWLGETGMASPGGLTGGAFLILALFVLLFSQLSGFQKSGRRRRSSSRRRRSS